jgi:UrcA family protein
MKAIALASALSVTLIVPLLPAQATPAIDSNGAPTVRVSFERAALVKPAAIEVLQARVRDAARQVCSGFAGRSAADQAHFDACYAQAMRGAQQQIDAARMVASNTGATHTIR